MAVMQVKAGPGQESWEKSSFMRKQANVTHDQEENPKTVQSRFVGDQVSELADKVFKLTMIIKIKGLVQKTEKYVDRW